MSPLSLDESLPVTAIFSRWPHFKQLMRLDRPVGTYLLLWPTLWGLWLASEGVPPWELLVVFIPGVYLMRAAGCVINDYADRKVDGQVERTKGRPLAQGHISPTEALALFFGLCCAAFVLVLFTNTATVGMSIIAVVLSTAYPFMKRYTHWPQVVLGAAFAMAIPMGFTAHLGLSGVLSVTAWLTFGAAVCMTIAYDTYYAMVDREDDLKVGIKSTAVLFASWDLRIIAGFQAVCVALLICVGGLNHLGLAFYVGLATMAGLFIYQYTLGKTRETHNYFKAFINSHWAALSLWLGLVIDFV